MSLSQQTARVAGAGKDTLKILLQRFGVTVKDELIDQYPVLASGILGYFTGTEDPEASIGVDGDYYLKTFSEKSISTLGNGSLVKVNENIQPKKFIKLDNDHYGAGTGVTLLRKDTFNPRQWDASELSRSESNRYVGCLLDNFCDLMWPQMLDYEIRKHVIPVSILVTEGYKNTTLRTIRRRGFALSSAEASGDATLAEGTAFSYLSSNATRIAYFDDSDAAVSWWLRSSQSSSTNSAHIIRDSGALGTASISSSEAAARPAFNVSDKLCVSDVPDSDGCYLTGVWYQKQNGSWVNING